MPKLISLFGDNALNGRELVASAPKSLADMALSGSVGVSGVQYALELVNRMVPKVDYSDFSNFVFFNSALDYFNITGDRMIAQYPYDGNYDDLLAFRSASDAYENFTIGAWPRWSGTGMFSSGVYAFTGDTSTGAGYSALTALSTTSSLALNVPLTLEYRIVLSASSTSSLITAPTSGAVTLFQHFPVSGSPQYTNPDFTVFLGSGTIGFCLSGSTFSGAGSSGSYVQWPLQLPSVSGVLTDVGYYMAWVLNPSGTLALYATIPGANSFPFTDAFNVDGAGVPLLTTWSFTTGTNQYNTGSSLFSFGHHPSASFPTGLTGSSCPFELTEVRYWTTARSSQDIYETYNNRVYPDEFLKGYWRFAEPYTFPGSGQASLLMLRDYSGYKLDATVYGAGGVYTFWNPAADRTGGIGMAPQDLGEPILSARAADVQTYALRQQASGTLYDRNNQNIITNFVPQQYFQLEDERNTLVGKNLLYLLARQFDELKVIIDQSVNILTANPSGFNMAPDSILDEVLKFWGWSTKGNFLSKEAFQWFFGLNVLGRTAADVKQGVFSNERLETELYQIKNEFWRRVLNNLPYLYKTKGTAESVAALTRTRSPARAARTSPRSASAWG